MRFTPPALALALGLLTVSSVGQSQRPDAVIDARSMVLVEQAREAVAGGRFDAANDALETALAVDPRNRAAFGLMGEVATRQGLPGKAIRLYRESLAIEPNDIGALAGQGAAMVAKGAVTKATENLTKIRALCAAACPEAARLAAVIEKGPPPAVQSAQVTPTVVPAPAKN